MSRGTPRLPVAPAGRPPPELRHGLCARPGADPAIWASSHPGERDRAVALCLACPARLPCREYSLQLGDRLIWGGLSAPQRRAVAAARQAALDAVLEPPAA
jgi:hypothetical protein